MKAKMPFKISVMSLVCAIAFFASITAAYANAYVSLTLYEWMYNDDSAPRAYEAGEPVHYFAENDPGSRRYVQFEIVDSHGRVIVPKRSIPQGRFIKGTFTAPRNEYYRMVLYCNYGYNTGCFAWSEMDDRD